MKTILSFVLIVSFALPVMAQDKAQEKKPETEQHVYSEVDQMPVYPGGEVAMAKYLQKNVVYPENSRKQKITGTVFLTFVVDYTGVIRDIKILRGVNDEINEEAIRVIKAMPKWIPGKLNGKKVPVNFNIPISFRL